LQFVRRTMSFLVDTMQPSKQTWKYLLHTSGQYCFKMWIPQKGLYVVPTKEISLWQKLHDWNHFLFTDLFGPMITVESN
jgi:hypothetical protein